jgi:hypothetical protein
MKLLLTSGGITNSSVSAALFELVGKEPELTSLVLIPTASNVQRGDKGWLIDDLVNLKKQNFRSISMKTIWERTEDLDGLGYVDFSFLPHLNNPHFLNLKHDIIEHAIRGAAESIYAVDDRTALKIVDHRVSVVGEGAWRAYS